MIAAPPRVSVIVANYNGARFLEHALKSALASTLRSLEVIVADDASTDESAAIVRRLQERDDRIVWLPAAANGGPGAARNRAMRAARGDWLAILDNDDLIHPERLARMIAFAEARGADLVSDDLLVFSDDYAIAPRRFLAAPECKHPFEVSAETYLRQSVLYGRKPNLGFLKPVFSRRQLAVHGIAYDESLRIAEDDDIVLQCLGAGMRYFVDPQIGYFYRKHGGSITQHFGVGERAAMIDAAARVEMRMASADVSNAALRRRRRALVAADRYHGFVEAAAHGRALGAVTALCGSAGALWLLRHPLYARLKRIRDTMLPTREFREVRRNVLFVSRQRITGSNNGSSAYLIDIATMLRGAGIVPHLLQPTPAITGRLPVMRLRPEMAVFESHLVRGVMRIGPWIVSLDPGVWQAACKAALARISRKLPLSIGAIDDQPFPHTISLPWMDKDLLFVAKHGRGRADTVILDYIFQTEAVPFLLRPDLPSAILVHDLYTLRLGSFATAENRDAVAEQGMREEKARLASVDVALAIQEDEATWIRNNVAGTKVILAPMAAHPSSQPQPGDERTVFFVGSSAPPNVAALEWFFAHSWPALLEIRPDARLVVAGKVADAFLRAPAGVTFLGPVDNLDPLYEHAGVVISPLTMGSGLKIKLVEALSRGKAIVATTTTLQGVADHTRGAVRVADDPVKFAAEIAELLANRDRRAALGERALQVARGYFAPQACYGAAVSWAAGAADETAAAHGEALKISAPPGSAPKPYRNCVQQSSNPRPEGTRWSSDSENTDDHGYHCSGVQ